GVVSCRSSFRACQYFDRDGGAGSTAARRTVIASPVSPIASFSSDSWHVAHASRCVVSSRRSGLGKSPPSSRARLAESGQEVDGRDMVTISLRSGGGFFPRRSDSSLLLQPLSFSPQSC